MKRKIKYFAQSILISSLILFSCSEDFLDVTDPTVLAEKNFPQKVADLDPILIDIYGRLQNGVFSNNMAPISLLSHDNDHGYNGAQFNEFALNTVNQDLAYIRDIWNETYLAIGKCNAFLQTVEKFRANATPADLARLDQLEGQVRFLRAFNYFYLLNLFGETPVRTEADKSKMGVPLWTSMPKSISEASKERASQGEVYDLIISDLKTAETLLKGVNFSEPAKANQWAVKSLLGKAYVFSLQYDKAVTTLKDVVDNSGKQLVSYDILRSMFNLKNEFNKESIFEVSYTRDPMGTTEFTSTGNRFPRLISVSLIDASNKEVTNGFGNLFVHDENIRRYGFDDTTAVNQKRADYIAKSKLSRINKVADPRLYASMFQPYVDSVQYIGVWRKIAKNRLESYSPKFKKAWGNHKYTIIDHFWRDNQWTDMNFYALRLADVYLLYAEALIKSNNPSLGLEYINKVHRRAYNQAVDVPSAYDYVTLTDRTKTVVATDILANDPLKYERWAELFGEGNWWLDVRRFNIGAQEVAYYKRVMGGPLVWDDNKYSLPIPTLEINSNSLIVQNP